MKNIYHVIPCGAIYKFRQYEYKDMARKVLSLVFSQPKELLNAIVKGDNYGRKLEPWGTALYAKLMNTVWKLVVEHLLDADRVIIPYRKGMDVTLYIGKMPDNPKRIAKQHKRLHPYFATEGMRYGVILDGVKHSYYFRMTQANRLQLYNNIKKGKNYH